MAAPGLPPVAIPANASPSQIVALRCKRARGIAERNGEVFSLKSGKNKRVNEAAIPSHRQRTMIPHAATTCWVTRSSRSTMSSVSLPAGCGGTHNTMVPLDAMFDGHLTFLFSMQWPTRRQSAQGSAQG